MESKARRLLERLEKKMRRGYRGEPVGTVAFYGPDNRVATKVGASINQDDEIAHLAKWLTDPGDVRDDDDVMQAVVDYLEQHGAASLVVTPGIYGCPHEEGIDYPEGGVCPECPYWAEHDREAIFDTLLQAPDRATWIGRRDHLLMLLAIQTGLRVAELASLCPHQVVLGPGAHIRCQGKGRKERIAPLGTKVASLLRGWLREQGARSSAPVFPSLRGGQLSRDAIERLVAKHAATAHATCPSLREKRVTPHVLRHTTAVRILRATHDLAAVALVLGHESIDTTRIYVDADLSIKERAIARTAPTHVGTRRYRPPEPCSRSSPASDFAASNAAQSPVPAPTSVPRGIIRCSA